MSEINKDDFCIVYELPETLTRGFCTAGPVGITFWNVDWFNCPNVVSDENLIELVKGRRYYSSSRGYIILRGDDKVLRILKKEKKDEEGGC